MKFSLLLVLWVVLSVSASSSKTHIYKRVNGLNVEAEVYSPTITPENGSPIIITIHGGGYVVGNKTEAYSPRELNDVLSRGWTLISIDYRLGPAVLFDDMVEDMQDAYKWIRTTLKKEIPSLNVDRIAIMGQSAGGGLALAAGYKLNPRPVAILGFYPGLPDFQAVYNPTVKFSSEFKAERDFLAQDISQICAYPHDMTNRRWAFLVNTISSGVLPLWLFTKDTDETAETLVPKIKASSPLFNVDASYPPTYLAQGTKDTQVRPEFLDDFVAKLRSLNVPIEYGLIPDADHLFDLDANSDKFWHQTKAVFDFAARYLDAPPAFSLPLPSLLYVGVALAIVGLVVRSRNSGDKAKKA